MAKIPPLFMIGWDDWILKGLTIWVADKGRGFKVVCCIQQNAALLFLYYKMSFVPISIQNVKDFLSDQLEFNVMHL